jgi:hypothetical protein
MGKNCQKSTKNFQRTGGEEKNFFFFSSVCAAGYIVNFSFSPPHQKAVYCDLAERRSHQNGKWEILNEKTNGTHMSVVRLKIWRQNGVRRQDWKKITKHYKTSQTIKRL